jgi:hypothetical protein
MTAEAARATLRAETGPCAVTARTEPSFFAALALAGLLVQFRTGPGRPGPVAGYAVSLPGLTSGVDGPQLWYDGHSLAGELGLAAMRARWRGGRPGTPPRPGPLTGPDATSIYSYAAQQTAAAARQIRAAPPGQAADIALAAADVLGPRPGPLPGRGQAAHRRLPDGRLLTPAPKSGPSPGSPCSLP